MNYRTILTLAGCFSLVIAIAHFVMIFVGAKAYEYFDAGKEMVEMALAGSPFPGIITGALTLGFVVFALYGFSGAEKMRELPALQLVLWAIGGIYTLRGLGLVVQLFMVLRGQTGEHLASKDLVFSCVSLVIGILYLFGTLLRSKAIG